MDEAKRENNEALNEPLIEGLDSVPRGAFGQPSSPAGLKDEIFARTSHVVRARARRRHLVRLALMAAVYIAGIATTLVWMDTTRRIGNNSTRRIGNNSTRRIENNSTRRIGNNSTRRIEKDALSDPVTMKKESLEEYLSPHLGPDELVMQSETASPEDRIRLLKQAGDLYLSQQYEVESALHCYRRALDALTDKAQLKVEPSDSWLLAALKDARK